MFKYLTAQGIFLSDIRAIFSVAMRHTVAIILLLLCGTAQAESYQGLESIRLAAINHIRSVTSTTGQTEITAGQIDARLKLAKCTQKLETYLPNSGELKGRVAVGVRCPDAAHLWSIFVPVSITHFAEVVITTQSLARGQVITKDHIALQRRPLTRLYNGYILSLDQVIDRELKQSVPRGAILSTQTIQQQMLIKRGQNIVIVAKNSSIYVRSQGVALSDGRVGGKIKVKNVFTNKIVEGTITYDGIIEIKI